MKYTLTIFVLLAGMIMPLSSQPVQGDSLRTGRICKIVLYNGFQTEGVIRENKNDTLKLETEITNHYIPVKDIRFVMDTSIDIFDREEQERKNAEDDHPVTAKVDTTGECDIYMSDKTLLKDVKLILDTDSTLITLKQKRSKTINISGIRKIVFKQSAPFGTGYFYGSVIGFALGFMTLAFSPGGGHPDFSGIGPGLILGLVTSIPFGLVGGLISSLTASDDTYLFDEGLYPAKINRIRYLIEKHY
jgi:hypothetical protein